MIKVDFKLDKRFAKRVQSRFERFEGRAGILEDGPHYSPLARGRRGSLQGGPVRQKSRVSNQTLSQVGESIRTTHRVPYLTKPFKQRTKERKNLLKEIGNLVTGKAKSYSKLETALRALIRTPILMQRYGRNALATARAKGFNRFLFDTGQFFKAIKAKVRVKRVSK